MGRPPHGRAAGGGACVICFWLCYIKNMYGYSLYVPYTFHIYIYIYILNMFHIFTLVFFLIYSVNRRQILIAKSYFPYVVPFTLLLTILSDSIKIKHVSNTITLFIRIIWILPLCFEGVSVLRRVAYPPGGCFIRAGTLRSLSQNAKCSGR